MRLHQLLSGNTRLSLQAINVLSDDHFQQALVLHSLEEGMGLCRAQVLAHHCLRCTEEVLRALAEVPNVKESLRVGQLQVGGTGVDSALASEVWIASCY